MTQPCDNCGNPSEAPTCDRCLGYQAWASDSGNPRPDHGKRHEQRVRDTRQHLGELPELYAALDNFWEPGSTPKDPDQRSGKSNPAWRCVVNLDVLDLTDMRLKDGADATRADYWRDAAEGARRQGVVQTLASWCRLVDEERREDDPTRFLADDVDLCEDPNISSETGYLLAHLTWAAEQPWFVELHDDVRKIWGDVRRAIGDRDSVGYVCPTCDWLVVPRYDRTVYACTGCERTWTMANEVDAFLADQTSVMTLPDCAAWLSRPLKTLHHWKAKGWIASVSVNRKTHREMFDVRLVERVAQTVRNGKRTEVA
jgi:ribosomal protein L37AE/L43A